MVDDQQLLARTGQVAQRTEPLEARNINGHNQIDIAAHLVGTDQQITARQRPQRLRQRGGCGEADLDLFTAAGPARLPSASPAPTVSASGWTWQITAIVVAAESNSAAPTASTDNPGAPARRAPAGSVFGSIVVTGVLEPVQPPER